MNLEELPDYAKNILLVIGRDVLSVVEDLDNSRYIVTLDSKDNSFPLDTIQNLSNYKEFASVGVDDSHNVTVSIFNYQLTEFTL